MPVDPEVQRMVTVDLPRTFANNLLFSTGPAGEAPYVEMLRSIRFATSQSRSDVKYCQGLNYIAALLLLVQRDEEKAFWTLNAIMSHVFSKDYFNEQLTGARIDQNIMEMLVRKQCPEMSKELDQMGCSCSMWITCWMWPTSENRQLERRRRLSSLSERSWENGENRPGRSCR